MQPTGELCRLPDLVLGKYIPGQAKPEQQQRQIPPLCAVRTWKLLVQAVQRRGHGGVRGTVVGADRVLVAAPALELRVLGLVVLAGVDALRTAQQGKRQSPTTIHDCTNSYMHTFSGIHQARRSAFCGNVLTDKAERIDQSPSTYVYLVITAHDRHRTRVHRRLQQPTPNHPGHT